MENNRRVRQDYNLGRDDINRRCTDKNYRRTYIENGFQKIVRILAFLSGSLLILLMAAGFFLEKIATPDQLNTMHFLFCLLSGFSTVFIGGYILMKLDLPLGPKGKMAISATAGIAIFIFAYLQPPFQFVGG